MSDRSGAVRAGPEGKLMMDPNVMDLLRYRDLTVPVEDAAPLEQYWAKMRHLRGQVDEALLADHEIAVTWTAVGEQA
jgi:hypothetical protein